MRWTPSRRWRGGAHLLTILAILVAILGLMPASLTDVAAQNQQESEEQSGQEVEQETDAGSSFLEVHLAECPPGFEGGTGGEYFEACHSTAIEGVDVTVTTADGETTIATQRQADDGPGVALFENLPTGETQVEVDWQGDEADSFFAYCSLAEGDDEVPVSPNDADNGTLELPSGAGVVCDWYITPSGEGTGGDSTIDLFAFSCEPDAVADAGNADFEDFQAACTEAAPDVDFHLVDAATEQDTVESTDDAGRAEFTYDAAAGGRFFADVPLEADERMFCATVDDPAAQEIEFDDTGVWNIDPGEAQELTCSWFLVGEAAEATAEVTPEGTEEPAATEEPVVTEEPEVVPEETEAAVEPSDVDEDTDQGAQDDVDEQAGNEGPAQDLGRIEIAASVCPSGYEGGEDFESLSANCTEPLDGVSFNFTLQDGTTDTRIMENGGPLVYENLQPGAYSLYSDIPLESANEELFCAADGGNRYEKEFNESGVTLFGDLQREQIVCEWYVIPTDLRGETTGASLEVHLAACPVGYTGDDLFDDCHGNGIADQEFTLSGPNGSASATTIVESDTGPGIVNFTELGEGEYTLTGGPPGDFGTVQLFCNVQPGGEAVDVALDSTQATFTIGENEDVLCDWYFIPDDQEQPPTPTEEPESRAEIIVTLFACPPSDSDAGTYGGATQADFAASCDETVNDVSFTLGDVGAPPLTADTGASGDGAVRFFELLSADYTLQPSLPGNLTSAAVFCQVNDGDPYQKALTNGGTTFVNVDGESIACDWYVVEDRVEEPAGPSGSITIRQMLCEDDAQDITDFDAECVPGASGTSFSISRSDGTVEEAGTPNDNGVLVFPGLPNGFYAIAQAEGQWCKAVADRVDSRSRVIVENGGNTDVVFFQCSAVTNLPDTGTGPAGTVTSDDDGIAGTELWAIALGLLAVPIAAAGFVHARRRGRVEVTETPGGDAIGPIQTAQGTVWMRFR